MLKAIMNGVSLNAIALRQSENDNGADSEEFAYDIDAIRENFEEAKGRKLKVANKYILLAIENISDQFAGWMENEDSEAIFAFIEKVEEAAKKVAVSDPGISAIAAKLNEDDAFNEELMACVDAIMKTKTTAVDMYAHLHRVLTRDELDGMPMVGTEEKDVVGTNFRPDKVKTKDKVSGVEIVTVWSNDLVSALAHVKPWETELAEVTKELASSGTYKKYANTSKMELRAMQSTLTGKRNGVRSTLKRAINLHHNFEAVSAMPLVTLEWIPGNKKNGILIPNDFGVGDFKEKEGFYATNSPKCFWMYPKGAASKGKEYSVTQLINFDVELALKGEGGGTYADLIATLSKGKDETDDKSGDGSKMDVEEAIGTFQRFSNFMDIKDNKGAYRKALADKKRDDHMELLETLEAVYHSIAPLWRDYEAELVALKEKAAQKAAEHAAIKAGKAG